MKSLWIPAFAGMTSKSKSKSNSDGSGKIKMDSSFRWNDGEVGTDPRVPARYEPASRLSPG